MAKKWTYEDVVKYVEGKNGKVLTKKEEYKNTRVKMDFTCNVCGDKISRTFKSYRDQNATSCRKCTNKKLRENRKLSEEEVYSRCNQFGATLLTSYQDYENNLVNLEFECACGRKFNRRLADLHIESDYRCAECNNHHKWTYEEVKLFIEDKGCILLSTDYNKNREPLKIQCKCGEVFYRKFNSVKDSMQYYCNHCASISKGEDEINKVLNTFSTKFYRQYKFSDCKNIRSLPFDFYIPSFNIAIEYDGKQHYKIDCFNMTLLDLMNLKRNDNIKTEYCKNNNIKLIRIPYWEFDNIEQIICQELK